MKERAEETRQRYNKQRNLCVTLLKKSKIDCYNNLNVKNLCDNLQFWKVVKTLFTNNIISDKKITLITLITIRLLKTIQKFEQFLAILSLILLKTQRCQDIATLISYPRTWETLPWRPLQSTNNIQVLFNQTKMQI